MPTLFARRYMRKAERIGAVEKALGAVIVVAVAGIVAIFIVHATTNEDYLFNVDETAYASTAAVSPKPESVIAAAPDGSPVLFPDPGLEGWRAPREIDSFDSDTLYIEIDGRAPAYLEFGFVELALGTYEHESDPNRIVDVYIYDMGAPDNALRMYRAEEPAEKTPVTIGTVAYQVGGAVFFCKDALYVQVMPSTLDDADAQAALRIAELVAARLE